MNIHVHLSTALMLKSIIEEELSIKVNPVAFLFGSIKPDFKIIKRKVEHTFAGSKHYVAEEVKKLRMDSDITNGCNWRFSEQLGVMMHYLSDSFCYAHSDCYKESIWKHHGYEFKQSNYILRHFEIMKKRIGKAKCSIIDLDRLELLLEEEYQKYLNRTASVERDLHYSLRICAMVSLSVIYSAVKNEEEELQEVALLHGVG